MSCSSFFVIVSSFGADSSGEDIVFSGSSIVSDLTESSTISLSLDSVGIFSSSFVSTPSLITTVSNCEKGLFTNSFIAASGVKEILSCPSIKTRSPVFTLTLSRGLTR